MIESLPVAIRPIWKERYDKVIRNNERLKIEDAIDTNNGIIYIQVSINPIIKNNEVIGGLCLGSDITERKNTEFALEESEAKYQTLADNSVDIINRFDHNYKHLYASPSAFKLTGIKHQDFIGKSHRDLGFPSEDCDFWEKHIQTVFDSGKSFNQLVEFEVETGKVYLDWLLSPEYDSGNNIISVLGYVRDITEIKKTQLALIEEHQRLESIIKGTNIATWEWNVQTGETIFNERWAEIIGYTLKEISPVSIDTWVKYAHPDDLKESDKLLEQHFSGEMDYYEFESRMKHKDGHWIWVMDRGKVTSRTADGKPLMMFGTHSDITKRKQIDQELILHREQLRNFAAYLQRVQEKERNSITLEIHDSLAQFLVALKMDIGIFKNKLLKSNDIIIKEVVVEELEQFIKKTENTIKSARDIMNGLRPEQLELLGFVEATEVHLGQFEENHHIKCRFENTLINPVINPEEELALFRIIQESLTNILKHAMASQVFVRLSVVAGKLILEIVDNGIGFDINNSGQPNSYGLIGMKELVRMLGGNFEISSKIGEGTTVRVELSKEA